MFRRMVNIIVIRLQKRNRHCTNYDMGYKKVTMVVGGDHENFEVLLNKYNGKKARHGFYNFESINIVSLVDATPMQKVSRVCPQPRCVFPVTMIINIRTGYSSLCPTRTLAKLFNDVRKGMGLKEDAPSNDIDANWMTLAGICLWWVVWDWWHCCYRKAMKSVSCLYWVRTM